MLQMCVYREHFTSYLYGFPLHFRYTNFDGVIRHVTAPASNGYVLISSTDAEIS